MDRHVDVFFNRIRGRDMHWNLYDLDVFFRNVFDNWHMVVDWNLNWIMDRFVNGHVNMLHHWIWCWNLKISEGKILLEFETRLTRFSSTDLLNVYNRLFVMMMDMMMVFVPSVSTVPSMSTVPTCIPTVISFTVNAPFFLLLLSHIGWFLCFFSTIDSGHYAEDDSRKNEL